jgi:hypothetical protein
MLVPRVKPGIESNRSVSYKGHFRSFLNPIGSQDRHNKAVEAIYVKIVAPFSYGSLRKW